MTGENLKKRIPCGPGGWNCNCCFPPPGKARRKLFKAARRSAKKIALTEIFE